MHAVACDPDILIFLERTWNAEHGPRFTSDALCDCSCSVPDDWTVCHDYFPLSAYRVDMLVTLAWASDKAMDETLQNATILSVREGDAASSIKERVVFNDRHANELVQAVYGRT